MAHTFDVILATLRPTFLGIAVFLTALSGVDWLVRTRRLSPFGPVARFMRTWIDPLLAPVERRVVRSGGLPSSAPWWALGAVVLAGIVLISLIDFVRGQVAYLEFALQGGAAGVYSLWLRLWGARVGSLVYWSPGVVILDRPFVRLGDRVVFGIGARLNPHVLAPDRARRMALHIAPIAIGDDALIGGYSLLLPGCEVGAGEVTPPFRTIHAFSRFEDGRRVPGTGAAEPLE